MHDGRLGFIDTPHQGNRRTENVLWCADNGCFSERFEEGHWLRFLERNAHAAASCAFATAPDVVGDAAATLERSLPWLPKIRALGYKVAYVLQNGATIDSIPWDQIDAVFVGGDDAFKIGPFGLNLDGTPKGEVPCAPLVKEAQRRGLWVHVGRVNSRMRYRFARNVLGADSVDGTYLAFGPSKNLPKLLSWIDEANLEAGADLAGEIDADADVNGWTRVDARHAHGYQRGNEILAVMFGPAGRPVHATYALYDPADAYSMDAIERISVAGAQLPAFITARLFAAVVDEWEAQAAA